jgi:hypothetical protein
MPGMSYEEKELVLEPSDNVLLYSDGLVEATTLRVRWSASLGLGHSSPSKVRMARWGISAWRNSTLSLGRAGNRRMTSPSLRFDVPRP